MKRNKKNNQKNYMVWALVLGILISSAGCFKTMKEKSAPQEESPGEINKITVTVVDVTPNDLGQVMIFAHDKKRNKQVFIKDFYSRDKNPRALKTEMNRYLDRVMEYKGKTKTIQYYKNSSGNFCIKEIR
ncbi:MAG: hypothetical protein GY754_26085 [bacterium]|nr:hypothetical protein [bacterium]